MKSIAFVLVAVTLAAGSSVCVGRAHTVRPYQILPDPGPAYSNLGLQVAIDGDSIISLADQGDGRSALLYRRGSRGVWAFNRALLSVPGAGSRADLAMKNGIAAIQLNGTLHVFQLRAGDWVESQVTPEARTPGGTVSISQQRIAVGTSPCRDDTLLLEETTPSSWTVTGRATGPAAACTDHIVERDLNNNYMFVRTGANQVHVYARSLTEEWPQIASFNLPADASSAPGPVALQYDLAVAPGSAIFRGEASVWSPAGRLLPLDYANNSGFAYQVVFRDGVAITKESWGDIHDPYKPYVYVKAGNGLEHAAILQTEGFTDDYDVSGRTVVASSDLFGYRDVAVFTLPSPLRAPRAVADDFDDGDASEWTPSNSFAIATRGRNQVYWHHGSSEEASTVLNGTDWTDYQSIEDDFTPTAVIASNRDRYAATAVRFIDERNAYLLKWNNTGSLQIVRRYQGTDTVLAQTSVPMVIGQRHRFRFAANHSVLTAWVDGVQRISANDSRHKHGGAALLAYRVQGDYDNVYVGPTEPLNLAWKNYRDTLYDAGRSFSYTRGHWQITGDSDPDGLSQTDTSTSAYALLGVDTDEESVSSRSRLDSFNGTTAQVAWFGLFGRYRDGSNYYQISLRSSNQLQIRKVVGGQLTVLAAVPFTVTPGRFYELRFDLLGDQLHAYVDGVLVAQAVDPTFTSGHYGLGTYRTAATFQTFIVEQP